MRLNQIKHYPFGLMMLGRSWSEGYRFGFNEQEQDDEVYGDGILNTALHWEYDTRLGRRWNVDPKPNPAIGKYTCFANNSILYSDIEGDTLKIYNYNDKIKPVVVIATDLYEATFTLPKDMTYNGSTINYEYNGTNSDAFMLSLDAGFSYLGGASIGFSIVMIERGKDKGGVFAYQQGGGKIGLDLGADFVAGDIDFNENNSKNFSLTRYSFEGRSQGASGSAGPLSIATVTSYVDGDYHYNPFKKKPDIGYQGTLTGVGVGGGGAYYFTSAKLIGTIVKPISDGIEQNKIASE